MSEEPSIKRVLLYGHLRARFGKEYRFAVGSAAEAIRALCFQVKGFRAYLETHSEPGYRVLVGTNAATLDTVLKPD